MPPKKKGKKKSGKGKKGKKGEPEISFQEAVLAYRIGLTEKEIDDWKYEEKNLEEQYERLAERNQRLLDEQEQYVKILLKQSKEFEKKNLTAEKVGKEKVMGALQEKWEVSKEEDRRLEEMQADILNLERAITKLKREKANWLNYKAVGSVERAYQIELLEKELKDMTESFEEMMVHLERNLDVTRDKIVNHMERTLNRQKHNASEKAMSTLDKKDRQEVLDNDWMKEEVNNYSAQCAIIEEEVAKIERENLALMEELFESNVEDLKITRNLFLTQFGDGESLADGGILGVDLKQVSLLEREKEKEEASPLQLEYTKSYREQLKDEEAQEIDEEYDDQRLTPTSDDEDPFDNYYNFEDDDIDEYLKLGPLELKLLSLNGESMPIHIQGGATAEETKAREYNPAEWPVTQPMLKSVTTPRIAC